MHSSMVVLFLHQLPTGHWPSLVEPAAQYAPSDSHACFTDGVGHAKPTGHSASDTLPSAQ